MNFFLPIILVCIFKNVLGEETQETIDYDVELNYQELKDMNFSCYPEDFCTENMLGYPWPVPHPGTGCSCHKQCSEYGTCCMNLYQKVKLPIQNCRNVGITLRDMAYYMVERCPYETDTDSIWKNLCEKNWNEEENLLMFSPLTSLDTSRTYKNYYCFKCHETTDNYVLWDLLVNSTGVASETNVNRIFYSPERKTWMATYDELYSPCPVNLSFNFPKDLQTKPIYCDPYLFADCPDTWADTEVRYKCRTYRALLFIGYTTYKNIHCALCNNAPIDLLSCYGIITYTPIHFNIFKNIIDVSEKVENANNCRKGYVWDPYLQKCQKLSCPIRRYVIKNGRCVPP